MNEETLNVLIGDLTQEVLPKLLGTITKCTKICRNFDLLRPTVKAQLLPSQRCDYTHSTQTLAFDEKRMNYVCAAFYKKEIRKTSHCL